MDRIQKFSVVMAFAICGCSILMPKVPADVGDNSYLAKKSWTVTLRNGTSLWICDVLLWKEKPSPDDATAEYRGWIGSSIPPGDERMTWIIPSDAKYNVRVHACKAGYSKENDIWGKREPGSVVLELTGVQFKADDELVIR